MKQRHIRFGDAEFDREARRRIDVIMDSRRNTEGRYVERFESLFAEAFGFQHAIMTSSGTTAGEVLWMAVREKLGIRWSDGAVITPALAFVATANVIPRAGLSPIMVDIDSSLNMQVDGRETISALRPIGVQFVLNMGRTANLDAWVALAKQRGLFVGVDACEGHGAELDGKRICDWADAAIYSFYPAHIMTVCGEGGLIATNDKQLADLCRSIKSHGRPPDGKHKFKYLATNAKATEIAAAVGISALAKFPEVFKRRREVRKELCDRLQEFVHVYRDAHGEVIAPHAMPVLLDADELEAFKKHLDTWTIEHKPLWGALSDHAAHAWLGIPANYFPTATDVGKRGLHFGCHESYTQEDLDYVYQVFKMFFNGNTKEAA